MQTVQYVTQWLVHVCVYNDLQFKNRKCDPQSDNVMHHVNTENARRENDW